MEKMLTVEEVARQFNVSTRTVLRLIDARQIRAVHVGRQWRFKQQWIDEWIAQNTRQTREDAG
jgi:excisionase family DNA binding protein